MHDSAGLPRRQMEGTREAGGQPFKPQTALLPRRTTVGSELVWRQPDKLKE